MGEGLGGEPPSLSALWDLGEAAHGHLANLSFLHKEMRFRRQVTTQGQSSVLRAGPHSGHSRWSLPSRIKSRYSFWNPQISSSFYFPDSASKNISLPDTWFNKQTKRIEERLGGAKNESSYKAHKPEKHYPTPRPLLRDSHHTHQEPEKSPAAKKSV